MKQIIFILTLILVASAAAQENWGEAEMVDSEYLIPFLGLTGLYNPSIAANDSVLFFNHEAFTYPTNTAYSSFFDDQWQMPEIFSYNLDNTFFHQYEDTILYFVAEYNLGFGRLDLWSREYSDGQWQLPQNLWDIINTVEAEDSPSLPRDGSRLYFLRGGDIMYSDIINGEYTEPIALPECINSNLYESHPVIHPDGDRLFFTRASDPTNYNPKPIFVSSYTEGVWQEPVALNDNVNFYLYNDPYYGYSYKPTFSLDGTKMYFGHVEFAQNGEIMRSIWVSQLSVNAPETEIGLPQSISVSAYPNPFNAETQITISGDLRLVTEVSIYDITGGKVCSLPIKDSVIWKGRDRRGREVASGLYFVKVGGDDFTRVEKLTLVR